jgi:hypothetical protein
MRDALRKTPGEAPRETARKAPRTARTHAHLDPYGESTLELRQQIARLALMEGPRADEEHVAAHTPRSTSIR